MVASYLQEWMYCLCRTELWQHTGAVPASATSACEVAWEVWMSVERRDVYCVSFCRWMVKQLTCLHTSTFTWRRCSSKRNVVPASRLQTVG